MFLDLSSITSNTRVFTLIHVHLVLILYSAVSKENCKSAVYNLTDNGVSAALKQQCVWPFPISSCQSFHAQSQLHEEIVFTVWYGRT